MKKKLAVLIIGYFLTLTVNGQKNDSRLPLAKFLFVKTDSTRTSYVYKTNEGAVIIDLYNDSLYSYHFYGVIEKTAKFSAGTWYVQNDTLLILKSDKNIFEKVFQRHARSTSIDKYLFLPFDNIKMVILWNKCIYPINKETRKPFSVR